MKKKKAKINYGVNVKTLPIMSHEEMQELSQNRVVIIIHGIIHDCTDFVKKHPGGSAILVKYSELSTKHYKDYGNMFDGGLYNHTNAARNLMSHMRVGKTIEFEREYLDKIVSRRSIRDIDVSSSTANNSMSY